MAKASGTVQALVFDIDGVLVDTERLHFSAWQKLLAEHGATLTLEEYLPFIGRGSIENMADICARKGIAGDHAALNLRRREIYRQLRAAGIPVLAENVALTRDFAREYPKLPRIAATNSIQQDTDENLAAAGLTDYFRLVVAFQNYPGLRRKPAPDLYVEAVRQLDIPAAECLAFEDTEHGVAAAHAAGLRVVALPSALTKGQDFSAADLMIPPGVPREATKIFKKIAAR
ncbi:MAG: HAD family phosphatase [bacterium]|nr:HAD family phosphatase [bacterium]